MPLDIWNQIERSSNPNACLKLESSYSQDGTFDFLASKSFLWGYLKLQDTFILFAYDLQDLFYDVEITNIQIKMLLLKQTFPHKQKERFHFIGMHFPLEISFQAKFCIFVFPLSYFAVKYTSVSQHFFKGEKFCILVTPVLDIFKANNKN